MKKLPIYSLLLVAVSAVFLFASQAHASAYTYYRSITVTSTASVASGTNANFPMLVSSTLSSWEPASDGGHIQNLVTAPNGGQEPADLVFATSSANCGIANLSFETESYVSSTGALVDWVNVPSVSTGTVIYVCYGNGAVTTDQSHPSSTWNSNYQGVYHFPNGTTLSTNDSTSFANNGTNTAATAGPGRFGGGGVFNGSSSYVKAAYGGLGNSMTMSVWAQTTTSTGSLYSLGGSGEPNLAFQLNSGAVRGFFTNNSGSQGATASQTINDGNWHDLVLTYASSTGLILYVDSAKIGTTGALGTTTLTELFVGSGNSGGSSANSFFNGSLDEARTLSTALSPSWILTEYNNQNSPNTFYAMGSESNLIPPSAPSISSFSASSSVVAVSGTSTLSWNITNASSVAITPGSFSTSTLVGSFTVNPTSTTVYTITATNPNGTSTATTTVNVATAPTTPGSFSVMGATTSTFSLSWASSTPNNSASISFYSIHRGTSTSTMPQIATTTNLSYTDTNLATSTTYFYYLTAQDSVGNFSASSSIASGTTQNGVIPSISSFSASSSVVAVSGTSTLSWNITNASSVAITPGSFSTSTLIGSTTINPTSTTIYTITATNPNGTSTATTTVQVATPPTAPGSFSVGSPSSSTLALNWASSTPNNGASISFYSIHRGTSTSTMPQIATTTNLSYTDTNLATSTTYYYYVTAEDSVFNISASSSIASTTTLSGILPSISSFSASPSVIALNGTSTLSWSVSNATSLSISPTIGTVTGSSTTTPALSTSTIYTLTATNSNGTSTATTTVTVDSTPPTTPASLVATPTGTSTILLSWASSTDSGGSGLTGYNIFRCTGFSCTPSAEIATSSGASYLNTGLIASTTYTYAVSAYDGVGNVSATSSVASGTTQNGLDPSISSFSANPSIVAIAGTSTLSWNITNASSVAITPGSLSTSTLIGSITMNPTSTTIYTITATNTNGSSTAMTTLSVAAAPTAPGSFSVGNPSTSTLSLSWASSTPNNGASISFYLIYRGTSTSSMPELATTTNLSYTDTNLATSNIYYYYVTAEDSVLNVSASSSIASGTTEAVITSGGGGGGGGTGAPINVPSSYGSPYVPAVNNGIGSLGTSASLSSSSIRLELVSLEAELNSLLAQSNQQGSENFGTAASNSVFLFSRNLGLWDRGPDVNALQEFLIQENVGPAARILGKHGATIVFGYLTYHALVEFQISVGIPGTGYLGPRTRAYINALE